MSKIVNIPDRNQLREQASLWLVRLQDGLSAGQKIELAHWLDQGDPHREALLEMAAAWDEMGVLEELAGVFPLDSAVSRQSAQRRPWLAAAASIVAVIGLALAASTLFFGGGNTIQTSPVMVKQSETLYESAIGERSTIHLPDGSIAILNTRSLMTVDFSDTERKVILMRGESHFRVSKDVSRPFVVKAGNSTVRAIGTAFNVFLYGRNSLEVSVEEGTVAVHSPSAGIAAGVASGTEMRETILSAGEVVAINNREAEVRRLTEIEMTNRLAWQTGMVLFEDERLARVLVELQRYTTTRLLLEDESLGDIRVAGYFKVGDVDALVIALRENFNIDSRREAPNTIVLSQM